MVFFHQHPLHYVVPDTKPSRSTVQPRMQPQIVPAAQTPVIRAYGDEVRVHLEAASHGGLFDAFTDITPPGGGPPPHFHLREDEWFYVLEGEPEFFDGERWLPVKVGGMVFMPRHSLHTFRNAGAGPLHQLVHTLPSGFTSFFRASEHAFQEPGGPDPRRLVALAAEHGIHFPMLDPGAAALRQKPALTPVIVRPGEGRRLSAFGEEVTVMLDGTQTGGQFTAFVEVTPPGGGPPPHLHEREDEWFYVLEGCVSFLADGRWTDAYPGDVVFAPREGVHTFKNNTDRPTRMLIHAAPSGFERFFAEAAEEFARPGGPDMARAVSIAGQHGIRFVQT